MNSDLPQGWSSVELKDHVYIAGRIGWRGLKSSEYSKTGPRFLAVKNIAQNGKVDFTETDHISQERYDESPEIQLLADDILLTKDGTIGKVGMIDSLPGATTVNSSILVVRPENELLNKRYLFHFLRGPQFQAIAHERITGSAIPHLFQKDIKKLRALVPPVAEQQRIVEKLEKLLDQVDTCQRRLVKISGLLKRFRQSVLAAACSGRLTADWREENCAKETESAEDLPNGWFPSTVGDVLEGLKYGTASKCGYEQRGVPVLRIPNVVSGQIDHTDLKFAELPAKEFSQLQLTPGDILLIRSNGSVSLVGRSAIVSQEQKGFAYAGYLIRLRPNRLKVAPEFLNLVLASYDVRLQIELKARSTSGVNNINSEEVQALRLLLPSLPEQNEIVRRVESLFTLADRIEARFLEGRKRVDSITQAILAKAFRGELVPTEFELAKAEGRSFESAEELLDRIKRNGQIKEGEKKLKPRRAPSAYGG